MNNEQFKALLAHQNETIEKIALGSDLSACLNNIVLHLESTINTARNTDTAKAAILLREGKHLRHGAAPGLNPDYCKAIDGIEIGPRAGSCGTAAFIGKQVIVSDIEHDPLWADYAELALRYELRACWSTPIFSSKGSIIGIFAVYYQKAKNPDAFHLELIQHFVHFARLAIEKHRSLVREKILYERLSQTHEQLNSLLTLLPELLLVIDEHGQYIDTYGSDESLQSHNIECVIGLTVQDTWPEDIAKRVLSSADKALSENAVVTFEQALNSESGPQIIENRIISIKHYQTDKPEKKHVLWMLRDITEQKQTQKQIEQLAFYDPLTNLPNRRLLMNRTQKIIGRAAREELYGALIYIDLNNFKRINDSLGHYIGDELLVFVAQRLQESIREIDTIARIGGDEFVILVESLQPTAEGIAEEANGIAERIHQDLDQPFELSGRRYKIGASIGVALIDQNEIDALEILKQADVAMYEAKKDHTKGICFHNAELQQRLDVRLKVESEINDALDHMAFHAFYQPQVDLDGRLIAAEALIRWHHPDRGLIYPHEFLSVAERMGVIHRMQQAVLTQTCQTIQLLEYKENLPDDFRIAINICPSQLKLKSLPDTLMRTLNLYKVSPSRFMLEITEGMLIEDLSSTIEILNRLRDLGFKISIDDFGTGYSSLAYLNQLPVNEIKIDKSFMDTISTETSSQGVVDTVVSLSKHFHFDVIAEGVEHSVQLEVMRAKEVKGVQGYLFAKPMNQADFVDWVAAA